MKIGFVINSLELEEAEYYTTTWLALAAHQKGHTIYYIEVGDLTYYSAGHMGSLARVVTPRQKFKTPHELLGAIKSEDAKQVTITSEDLDVLWLRYNPVDERDDREWIRQGGLVFAQVASDAGVLVLNDPYTLSHAINKMYFQHFPELVRPKTIITRRKEEILKFYEENNQHVVLKPLMGSGGSDVYMLNKDLANMNQIVTALGRMGYIIAQEYLPEAAKGDVRMFLMNGKPLMRDGKYAAVRRVNATSDFRSNISVGATIKKVKVTNKMLELAEAVRPKIIRDGLFLVGLDIAGDKIIEINVISSGALQFCGQLEETDFCATVIEAIEEKLRMRDYYEGKISNRELAVME
ncbi:glutathione synthase [Catalinimonas alkaloidigena]|uniref:Glutathione synthetase n=1 Tax=Catalinimonas alkaloidigena TaxID=1075417 RepID=A0A1G9SJJ3_9BACT|nr:glutathione synthetase [Catalinimonas alkaloidigena]SDM35653.1 glutathione synthase [Catalinimonas alkaloidigena]